MSSWPCLTVMVGLAAIHPVPTLAQGAGMISCGQAGGAVLKGTVVNDSTGLPVPASGVALLIPMCGGRADESGRFRFDSVAAGSRLIDANHPGFRDFRVVTVDVPENDSVVVELRLVPGGPIADCRVSALCAPVLQPYPDRSFTPTERLELAIVGTGIAIGRERAPGGYACFYQTTPAVFEALAERYERLARGVDCGQDDSRRRRWLFPSGEPAFLVWYHNAAPLQEGRWTVLISVMTFRSGGRGWQCEFVSVADGYEPEGCVNVVDY